MGRRHVGDARRDERVRGYHLRGCEHHNEFGRDHRRPPACVHRRRRAREHYNRRRGLPGLPGVQRNVRDGDGDDDGDSDGHDDGVGDVIRDSNSHTVTFRAAGVHVHGNADANWHAGGLADLWSGDAVGRAHAYDGTIGLVDGVGDHAVDAGGFVDADKHAACRNGADHSNRIVLL